jgi:hypothetical protein
VTEDRVRPLLSVVVPVYGVEPYLRECLDSLFRDPLFRDPLLRDPTPRDPAPPDAGVDVEVVAVDDASPDGCPAILDAYARTHPGLRVVRLAANVGLGRARNAGLDAATGEYVWFVDSDDWLPAGALPAVLDALRADRPDVLLLDHVRVHDDGRVGYDASSPLLRGRRGAAPLSARPALLGVQHAAWNKVIRTDYLRRLGLRFPPGWYEDFPFSHPLLIAAGTVGVLDRVCYAYRQRPSGITHTVSDRHFEALDQYERLFATLAELGPVAAPFRPAVFRLAIDHGLVVAGNERRVPAGSRAAFFHRLADLHRRHRPAGGYPRPGGVLGLKHRMVAADAYPAYAALRSTYRALFQPRPAPATPALPPPPTPADLALALGD